MPSALHDAAMQLYRQYLVVGGMPECVMQFVQTGDYILIRHTQDTILTSYLNDMSKYNNLNEIKKTRLAYDNITVQLSKKNTRFQYKLIKKGGRASEFENAIEWLCLSGIVSQVYRVEQIKKPLENYLILMRLRFMFRIWGCFAPRRIWLQTIFSIWWRN